MKKIKSIALLWVVTLIFIGCGSNGEMVEKAQYEQAQSELERKEKMLQQKQSEWLDLKNKILTLNAEIKDQQKQIENLLQITDSLEYRVGVEAKTLSVYEEKLTKADSMVAQLTAEKEALEAQLTGNQQQIQYTLEAKAARKSDQQLGELINEEPLSNLEPLPVKEEQPVVQRDDSAPETAEEKMEKSGEMAMEKAIEPLMQITDSEYRERYDEALKLYFAKQYDKAIIEFEALISHSKTHDLADNCQYWIGESYYSKNEFDRAIDAFSKVLNFQDSNKKDHSQYKIGASYLKLEQKTEALQAFKQLVENYPDSDMVPKVREMLSSGAF